MRPLAKLMTIREHSRVPTSPVLGSEEKGVEEIVCLKPLRVGKEEVAVAIPPGSRSANQKQTREA